jgi:hypothetical protein
MEDDERHEQETWEVGILLDPYLGDSRVESRPGHLLCWTEFSWFFSRPPAHAGLVPRFRCDASFQILSSVSSFHAV